MNSGEQKSFTAYIGIDWEDKKHDMCIQSNKTEIREFDQMPHQPDELDQWVQSLMKHFGAPMGEF